MVPHMISSYIPEELRGIQKFLIEAAKTKAEQKPDYSKFKHVAESI
jgi:hypothetical protein